MPQTMTQIQADAERMCRDLLRLDTSNYGDGSGPGERAAAEYVAEQLSDAGWSPVVKESEPGRASVLLRIEGTDPTRPALVVHGHTDVVPAVADEWSVPPFAGEIQDGCLWGRGAVDMKDMDAMMLAAARDMKLSGWRPPRDIVLAIFADEEAGGRKGAHWIVDTMPEFFEGATEAISEVGGFSVDVAGTPVFLLQTAEKGLAWLRIVARGTAGHGSAVNRDNAVTELAAAIARIGAHAWPYRLTGSVRALLAGVAELTGLPFDEEDPGAIDALVDALGPAKRFVGSSLATVANPSGLKAGYKANVIPSAAEGTVDVRYLPGAWDAVERDLAALASPARVTIDNLDIGLEAPASGDLYDAMAGAILRADPGAKVLPYMLSGGTDNKSMSQLGIAGYGFAPLKLGPEFDFTAMFHGVDERIPLESLAWGTAVLWDFLRSC